METDQTVWGLIIASYGGAFPSFQKMPRRTALASIRIFNTILPGHSLVHGRMLSVIVRLIGFAPAFL